MNQVKALIQRLSLLERERVKTVDEIKSYVQINIIDRVPVDISVGAVDASIISKEFHAFDLIVTKTSGAIFNYKDSRLDAYKYLPSPFPPEKIFTLGSLDLQEFNIHKSLLRLEEELKLLLEIGDDVDIILVDGSLFPLPSDRPLAGSSIFSKYSEILELYAQLHSKYTHKLAGIVKDSRSRMFLENYRDKMSDSNLLNSTIDSVILDMMLEKGQYVGPQMVDEDKLKDYKWLKGLEKWLSKLNVFYLKAGSKDRPLRIETFNPELLPYIYTLSAINDSYSYPAILIDVDLRAMIDPKIIERVQREVNLAKMLSGARTLRRESRPFRR